MLPGEVHAAGIILRRRTARGWCWLLLRASRHREWGFAKGHLEPGETPWQAALRECAEETGIAALAREGDPLALHYRLPDGRGKTVTYFAARTATTRIVLSEEHAASTWCDADGVVARLPHPGLRALFTAHLALVRA